MEIDAFRTALVALALVLGAPSAIAADRVTASSGHQPARETKKAVPPAKVIDINSASKAELATLWGIDAATADKIIAGRPYHSKAELATRNIIPKGIYEANRKRIMARQNPAPERGPGRR